VYLTSSKTKTHMNARSAPDGSFGFSGLEGGDDYRITVFPRSLYKDLRRTGIVVNDGETVRVELELEFAERGVVEGTAFDAGGKPLSGFAFRVRSIKSWSQAVKVVTGPDGSFRAEDVPCGDILFDTQASPHYSIRGLTLKEGEEKRADLVFGVGDLEVEGVVTDPDGNPASGVRVILSWTKKTGSLTSSVQHTTVTDTRGWYRLTDLPPGSYHVGLEPAGHPSTRLRKTLAGNARWDLQLSAKS